MEQLDAGQIINTLREGGSVAARLDYFEPRQAQLDLMRLIIKCFNNDGIGAAEAGTGVGKSFAYLLPALYFTAQNKERVVISTATITLQQQLFGKDIPLVQKATGSTVKAVLVKGRSNYLCLRRLEDALTEPELAFENEQNELKRIADWAKSSASGGRDELSFTPSEKIWSRVCSDADLCTGKRCPQEDRCFVIALRKEAAAARIIVVNHHLLFADLAVRREKDDYQSPAVLPPYSRLIIDEAHTIEDAATSFFSKEFSRTGVTRQVKRLYRSKKGTQRAGLLVRFCSLLPDGNTPLKAMAAALGKIQVSIDALDEPALDLCGNEGVFRLSPGRDNSSVHTALFPLFTALNTHITAFTTLVRGRIEQLPGDADDNFYIWEIKAILRRFDAIAKISAAFTEYRQRQHEVMWIERRKNTVREKQSGKERQYGAAFIQSPIELAESLKETLFLPHKTVVCVSATLALSGSFNYWAIRCGAGLITSRPLLTGCFPSPFPYSGAVLLAAPNDAPLPDEPEYQDFVDQSVSRLAAASGGSALILFTSYQSLHSAWNAALPTLQSLGIRCLKQGDEDRSRLLQTFLADTHSVLFATDSFWEGVDAPGDTLRLVILCRLPFRTPTDPVFEARREAVQKNGGNAFMDISLPEAVMKFKQGFGRLMRRSSDRGVVAVLDSRIIKKRYGAVFLQSLPETRTSFTGFSGIVRDTENFLFS